MVVMVVMMMMMMMPVRSRADSDVNAGAMVMMVMMVISDHNLGGSEAATLRQPFVVGFQEWQGIRDRIEKVAISRGLREFRAAHGRGLDSAHRA
jgi:hypothetical protein